MRLNPECSKAQTIGTRQKQTTLLIIIFLALLSFPFISAAQDSLKHLYLANDTHTDLMWNGDEQQWYQYSYDMARFYLKLGEDTRNNTPEARSKWNYDAAWTLYMLEKQTPEDFFNRIIEQIKNGQASVPYNFTLPVYGGSSLESVLRSFYYGGYLERTYGIDIDLAVCQENATIPLGLASLWAGSGARYSWKGVCNCATKVNTLGQRDQEIYWYTGVDGSRILMKWYSNYGWNAELGGYSETLEPTVAVIQMDTLCGSERYPYNIAGAFGKGWDNMQNYSYDLVWGLGHRTRPDTKLFLSNESDFFRDFESCYGDQIPQVTLAYGNEWELGQASLAAVSSALRRSMEKLRTAEAMAAIVSSGDNSMFTSLEQKKKDFLYGISMYNLHGWTADGPVNRHDFATYMRSQQRKIADYVDALYNLSLAEMGKRINPGGLENTVFIFNALNWERSGMVDIPMEKDFISVRDPESGEQIIGSPIFKDGAKYLRIYMNKIPSVGYRVFQLTNDAGTTDFKDNFRFSDGTLETTFYTAVISRSGAISSLIDKKNQKNWVKGWLNDPGSKDHENGEEIQVAERGERFITLKCQSDDPVKHECFITFYADHPRIDFQNIIKQNFEGLQHWSFDFNIEDPEVWHEEVGAVIKAKLTSAGGHYADRMARYDYLTLNHFADVGNNKEGITLSNADCLFFRLGNSTPEHLDMNSSTIHILAAGQVDKDKNLGIFQQDGDSLFYQHFSLMPRVGAFEAGSAMKFSLEHQNPLVAGNVTPGGEWKWEKHSFTSNDKGNVILWALKPGEEGGLTLRFWNIEPEPVMTKIFFNHPVLKAVYATHVETDMYEIPVSGNAVTCDFNKYQMKTYRVWLKKE
jgi:alpha-mannosidase